MAEIKRWPGSKGRGDRAIECWMKSDWGERAPHASGSPRDYQHPRLTGNLPQQILCFGATFCWNFLRKICEVIGGLSATAAQRVAVLDLLHSLQ